MHKRFFKRNGKKRTTIFIGRTSKDFFIEEKTEMNMVQLKNNVKSSWFHRFLSWFVNITIVFLRWLWSHPKRLIKYILSAVGLWLLSFLPFKLPNLPFLPIPVQSKPQENKKEDKKPEEKKQETKQSEQSKTNTITVTNIVTQTNIVTKTNTVNETKYATNFVVQPIVVTNTVFKEVPVTVTNVLIIKNNITDTNSNQNKNGVINGPAFFFTDDFNTLLQNQQQNPIRARTVN